MPGAETGPDAPTRPSSHTPCRTLSTTSPGVNAAEASIVMPGKRRVNRRVNAPSGSIPGEGMVTSSTVPRRSPLADAIVARAVRRSRST